MHLNATGYPAISLRNHELTPFRRKNKEVQFHRLIVCPLDGLVADHINGDRTDMRRENLRLVTMQANAWNRGAQARRNGQYKGVVYNTIKGKKYIRARIIISGKYINLGMHSTDEDAARAYDKAAREHYGQYARTNFPVTV